jgi:hypothetical protein
LRREREKLENGGIGDGSETLVGPAAKKEADTTADGDVPKDPEASLDVPTQTREAQGPMPEDTTTTPHAEDEPLESHGMSEEAP